MAKEKEAPPAAEKPAAEAMKMAPTVEELLVMIQELQAKVAEMEGEKVALEAARDVLAAQLVEARAVPARDADADALADVDAAMRDGRFSERQKVAMVAMRKASKAVFDSTIALMPVLGARSTVRSEVKPPTAHATAAVNGEEAALTLALGAIPEHERAAFVLRQKARIAARKGV